MSQLPTEVANFFLAMQSGKPGADALMALFAEDAIYEEPFTGETRRHNGKDTILAAMALGWEMPMVDTRIEVREVEVAGAEVHVGWTCHSPSLPGGKGSGRNVFTFREGVITSLITTLEDPE